MTEIKRTRFEDIAKTDFELIHYEDLLTMRDDLDIEIKKRQKIRWEEYFNNVINAIDKMIEQYGNIDCLDIESYSYSWKELKDALIDYDIIYHN